MTDGCAFAYFRKHTLLRQRSLVHYWLAQSHTLTVPVWDGERSSYVVVPYRWPPPDCVQRVHPDDAAWGAPSPVDGALVHERRLRIQRFTRRASGAYVLEGVDA